MKQTAAARSLSYSRTAPPPGVDEPAAGLKRAVIYLRVSTDRQVKNAVDPEGYSLPAQRDACLRKAEALGADVVDEYVDHGETARLADRPEFQRMVSRVTEQRDIDFVIVHKLNRFARNRRDDANFLYRLHESGAKLVSVSENIDDSPSGRLLHGIMASIAEYESANLATEALKGMSRKAQSGGTPNRAPLGYLNRELIVDGRQVRGVVIDEDRAPLIQWAFEQYATGEWTIDSLADALDAKGLRTKPTKRHDGVALGSGRLHEILRNRYYIGFVSFRGVEYPGIHEPLIPEEVFEQVQTVLSANVAGEKQRSHPHYLKSTVWCGTCGARLALTNAKGRYLYFFCLARQKRRANCTQRYLSADSVEATVERFYGRIQLTPARVEEIRAGLSDELAEASRQQARETQRQTKRLEQLRAQRAKLLHAHYEEAIPLDLLKSEQQRIAREVAEADHLIASSSVKYEELKSTIERALDLAGDCHAMYMRAPNSVRRQFNQTFFEKLYVLDGEVVSAELRPTFAALLAQDTADWITEAIENSGRWYARSSRENGLEALTRSDSNRRSTRRRCSSQTFYAALTGFEPGDEERFEFFASAPRDCLGRALAVDLVE